MYTYKALVKQVSDGDTITVDIDLGFYTTLKDQKIRLLGIDAPEVRGHQRERGLFVRRKLADLILGKSVILKTFKDKKGKYGRWLAVVYYGRINVNGWLLKEGLVGRY